MIYIKLLDIELRNPTTRPGCGKGQKLFANQNLNNQNKVFKRPKKGLKMSAVFSILAENATSISELKKNPMAIIAQAGGMPVAVLNHNQPAFYCLPVEAYEAILEKLDDLDLAKIVKERQNSS